MIRQNRIETPAPQWHRDHSIERQIPRATARKRPSSWGRSSSSIPSWPIAQHGRLDFFLAWISTEQHWPNGKTRTSESAESLVVGNYYMFWCADRPFRRSVMLYRGQPANLRRCASLHDKFPWHRTFWHSHSCWLHLCLGQRSGIYGSQKCPSAHRFG